jgi:hypothetical protein
VAVGAAAARAARAARAGGAARRLPTLSPSARLALGVALTAAALLLAALTAVLHAG